MNSRIAISGFTLETVGSFIYLGSTISSSLSIDAEVNSRIAKAEVVTPKLNQRVWNNSSLTEETNVHIYQICELNSSEA